MCQTLVKEKQSSSYIINYTVSPLQLFCRLDYLQEIVRWWPQPLNYSHLPQQLRAGQSETLWYVFHEMKESRPTSPCTPPHIQENCLRVSASRWPWVRKVGEFSDIMHWYHSKMERIMRWQSIAMSSSWERQWVSFPSLFPFQYTWIRKTVVFITFLKLDPHIFIISLYTCLCVSEK